MIRIGNEDFLFTLIKLLTYIIASAFLLTGSDTEYITILAVCIAFLIFNSFFRQLYLHGRYNSNLYCMASMVLEIALITYIGTMDRQGSYFIYFYFVSISESAIVYPASFSLSIAASVVVICLAFAGLKRGVEDILSLVSDTFLYLIVAVGFVFIMSYQVKIQLIERQKTNKANRELEQAYKRLLDNAYKTQELSVEKERTRMAREIHDTLAHTLTAAVVQLEACKKLMEVDSGRAREEIEKAQNITREGLNEVKRTIKALRPRILESRSFSDAIIAMTDEIKQNTNISVIVNKNFTGEFKVPPSMEIALFRAIQESVTNSVRHGSADKIEIGINYKGNRLYIDISDNGKGCSNIRKGFGLQGIAGRIEGLNGSAVFSSSPGNGFKTDIIVPYVEENSNEN